MADLVITAANVLAGSSAQKTTGTAGTTITAGQALYVDTADNNRMKLADADGASPANVFAGIALNGAAAGQPVQYAQIDADFKIGAAILSGDVIYLSDTPGGLTKTFADLESGDVVIVVGVGTSTTNINLSPVTGGMIA